MDEMIAFCGLTCSGCPAYVATQNDNDDDRRRVAEMWSKEYGADIKPEDINCDGCLRSDGRHIDYWRVCEIRKCGQDRGVVNCARCDDYACEKLVKFFEKAPEARDKLSSIRQGPEGGKV